MMRLYTLLLLTICFYVKSQDQIISLNADEFYGIDDFEAIYYSNNNTLFKYIKGKKTQFYDVQLGDLTSVDLINPLKILLFYKDTQTVVLLDNRLNENQRIVLSNLTPYRYIEHVKLAGERRLWLHDLDQNRLQLYNYINNTVIVSTPSLKIKVNRLHTDYNFCHVEGSDQLHSFNSYGSRTNVLDFQTDDLISYDFNQLALVNDTKISVYGFDKEFRFRESENLNRTLPKMDIKSLYLKAGKLYIWDGKKIHIYHINPDKE